MIINYFTPKGISFIREETKLNWAEDSLFTDGTSDSVFKKTDSLQQDKKTEKIVFEKKNLEEVKIVKPEEKQVTPTSEKTNEEMLTETKEIVEFNAPQAIKLEQAYSLYDKGVLFIDARDEADYLAGHITSSINIPFDDFDNHEGKLKTIPEEKPLVVYCAGTDCDLSILLGNLLFERGYKQVYIFFGGWGEWLDANYPVEHSSEENQN